MTHYSGIITLRNNALTNIHSQPAGRHEQSLLIMFNLCGFPEQIYFPFKFSGNRHGPTCIPKGVTHSPISSVVDNKKVPNATVCEIDMTIGFCPVDVGKSRSRKVLQQDQDCNLKEINTGGVKRLQKAPRQTNCYAVLMPAVFT